MTRTLASFVSLILLFLAASCAAQTTAASSTTTCTIDDSREISIEYQPVTIDVKKHVLGKEIPFGKVWAPGGKPMALFTNTPIVAGNTNLPIGAYTLFIIPDEHSWTLIISKSTDTSGKYNEKDDLARVKMQVGALTRPEEKFLAYFAHVAPTECNIRFDLQRDRAWTSFLAN
ncbi:MAG TPA: DUF2911 domain-containing protein [Terriglobales bacterium]|nr:DUF2911 domain-containing protein [Terriglobales bacterium]